jgi:hypothetical protein
LYDTDVVCPVGGCSVVGICLLRQGWRFFFSIAVGFFLLKRGRNFPERRVCNNWSA